MPSLGVTALIATLVVGRFLVRELRERKYRVNAIYVVPAILALASAVFIVLAIEGEPHAGAMLFLSCAAGFVVGGGIGYGVAHFTTVRVTDDPSVLYSRGSYATVAIWVAALALRLVARLGPGSHDGTHASFALNAALLVLLASALFFVRFRLLLAAKRERAFGIATAEPAI